MLHNSPKFNTLIDPYSQYFLFSSITSSSSYLQLIRPPSHLLLVTQPQLSVII